MAIYLTKESKVLVQGMTGGEGMKHTRRMLAAGTNVVGGVTPGKGGQSVDFGGTTLPVNSMRFTFLNPHAQAFYPDWAQVARSAVAALRIAAARNPDDQQLMNLIGELSMRSEPFRAWWAAQDVYVHRHGTKRFRHPAIGELDLDFEGLELTGDETLTVVAYSAQPGTSSGDGLELLASWAATQEAGTASTRD